MLSALPFSYQPLSCWINLDAPPTSNFHPVRLLDPDCWYRFTYLMVNSADPDQLASSEANWSGSVCKGRVYPGSAGQGLNSYLIQMPIINILINLDAPPTSNFHPVRLLDPDCWYRFTYLMANSADPDQLASSEASWSGTTLFAKAGYIRVQQDKG